VIFVVVPLSALATSAKSLSDGFPELVPTVRLVSYPELLRLEKVPCGAWVLTSLSTLSNEQLSLLREFESAVIAHGSGIRLLGSPSRTLSRDAFFEEAEKIGVQSARTCSFASLESSLPDWAVLRWEHQGDCAESEAISERHDLREVLARMVFEGLDPEHIRGVTVPGASPYLEPMGHYFQIGGESLVSDSLAEFWKGTDRESVSRGLSELLDRFGWGWARFDFARTPRGPALWRIEDGPGFIPHFDSKSLGIPGAAELRSWFLRTLRALNSSEAGDIPLEIAPTRLQSLLLERPPP